MADLPMNTTYQTGGASSAPPTTPKFNASDLLQYSKPKGTPSPAPLAPERAAPNIMGAYAPVSQDVKDYLSNTQGTGFLPQTPIGAPSEQKIFPTPKEYSPFVVPGEYTNPASGVVPEKPAIQQFPAGGQMNIDLANPGTLNKSVRATLDPLSSENASILGTLSKKMFQVDHIIPLWAGGADTIGNKQILPIPIHDSKTKIQSVAQTLLDNGIIDLAAARVMALNWQHRNAKGIPTPNDYGEIPIDTAKALSKEWEDFDAGNGPGPSFKQIMRGIPEAAANLGKGVLPEWARQFVVGVLAGATAHGVPLESAPGATILDKTSGIAGEFIGMYVGIGKFAKLTDMAGRAVGLIKPGIKMAAGATEGGASILDGLVTKTVIPAGATAAEKASLSIAARMKAAIRPSTIMNDIRGKLATDIVGRATRNAAAFGAYGQAGQLMADFTQPQEAALGAHIDRLWQDLAFGGIVGAAPGTWKGAGWVGGGVTTLGLMSGENLQTSLAQGLAMTALHKIGGFGQDIAKQQKEIERLSMDAAGKGALTVLHTVLGERPGLMRVDPAAPMPKYEVAQLDTYLKDGVEKLAGMRDSGQITPTLWMKLETSLRASVGTLKTLALPFEKQDRTFFEGLSSMAKFSKERNNVSDLSVPNSLQPYAKKFAELFPERIKESPTQTIERERWAIKDAPRGEGDPKNRGAVGEIPFTGEHSSVENLADHKIFQQKLRSGEASPYGIIMNTNDPLFGIYSRNSNRAITPKDTANGVSPIEPENHLRLFAIVTDKATGEQSIIRTGLSVPTKERIGTISVGENGKMVVDGNPQSFNSHPNISGPTPKYPANDPNFNNKTISTVLQHRGLSAIPVRFKSFLNEEVGTNPRRDIPYTIGVIGDEELGMARQMQKALGHPAVLNAVEENLAIAKRLSGTGMERPYAKKAAEQLHEQGRNVSDVVAAEKFSATNEPRQGAVAELLEKTSGVLSKSSSAGEVSAGFKKELGVKLKPEEAKMIEETKETITAPQVIKIMDTAVKEGRATPMTAGNFSTQIKPLSKSREFRGSTSGTLFNDMPIVRKGDTRDVRAEKISDAAKPEAATAGVPGADLPFTSKQIKELENTDWGASIGKPVEKVQQTSPETKLAIDELEKIGLERGGSIEPIATDTYTGKIVQRINESPEENKKDLAKRAIEILNSEDELALRGMQRSRSDEAWTEGTRSSQASNTLYPLKNDLNVISAAFPEKAEEAKGLVKLIDRTIKEYGSGDAPIEPEEAKAFIGLLKQIKDAVASLKKDTVGGPAEKIAATELEEAAMAKADVAPWFEQINKDKVSSPDTYQRGYAQAFDALAKKGWGDKYQQNVEFMKILTDKTEIGKKVWTGTRYEKGKQKPGLLASQPITARSQIGQPVSVIEAAGAGDRRGMSEAMTKRGLEREDTQVTKLDEQAGDVIEIGGHVTSSRQAGVSTDPITGKREGNVKDLTPYESERRKGLLDEEVQGPDPIKSPVRGAEDAMSDFFGYWKAYNAGIRSGALKGGKAPYVDSSSIVPKIKEAIQTEYKMTSELVSMVEKAQAEIAKMKGEHEVLSKVGGSRAIAHAKGVEEKDRKRIAQLEALIKKVLSTQPGIGEAKIAQPTKPKVETKASAEVKKAIEELSKKYPDNGQSELNLGQGGPGYSMKSPATHFASLAMGMFGGGKEKGNPITIGPATYTSTIKPEKPAAPTLEQVNTAPAQQTLDNSKDILSKMPSPKMSPIKASSPFGFSIPAPKMDDSPTVGLTSGVGPLNPPAKGQAYYLGDRGQGFPQTSHPVIAGVDMSEYAENPRHIESLKRIISELPPMAGAQDYQNYISRMQPRSPVTGQMVANAVAWNQLNPEETNLLMAAMVQDSSLGTAGRAIKTKNPGNVGNTGSSSRYHRTWDDGVNAVSNYIAQHREVQREAPKQTDPSRYIVREFGR